jgi:hypothetical protein
MRSETKTVFKWFWAWEDESEEAWLREMSRQGWHLLMVSFPGQYRFVRGEPRDCVYRLDFMTSRKDYQQYLRLFSDAGWTHLGEYGAWQYFRTEAAKGEAPEIYTDAASKIKKYQRVLFVLVPFLPIYIFLLSSLNRGAGIFSEILTFVFFLILLVYLFAAIMIVRRIRQLNRQQS